MNFSQILVPLPVLPHSEESGVEARAAFGEFVSEQDVTRVLLGTTGHLPVEGLPAEDFGFAGRADVRVPATVFVPVVEDESALSRQPRIHPAFAPLVEDARRRAAPPQPAEVLDLESAYGVSRGKASDLWWMMGVGVAVAALLFSGALFDFSDSREISEGPAIRSATAPSAHVEEEAGPAPSLASARRSEEVR